MADSQAIIIQPAEATLVLVHYEGEPLVLVENTSSPEPVNLAVVSSGGPQGASAPAEPPKSITVPFPEIGDSFTLYRTDADTVFSSIIGTIQGSDTPSVSVEITYGSSRGVTTTDLINPTTLINDTTGTELTLLNQPVPANNYIVLTVAAVTGTVTELNLAFRTAP